MATTQRATSSLVPMRPSGTCFTKASLRAGGAADVHDGSAARAQRRQRRLRDECRAIHVGLELTTDELFGRLVEWRKAKDAGVVDDHVKLAGIAHRARDSRADVLRIGDVGAAPTNVGMSNTRFLKRLLPPRDPEDGRTRLLERHRDRLADSRVGARHENDLAFECLCHAFPLFRGSSRPREAATCAGAPGCGSSAGRRKLLRSSYESGGRGWMSWRR